jgi:hypothetical protein
MDEIIIENLKSFLTGHMAHKNFEDAISNFPIDKINMKIDNIPYTFYQLLEHIRISLNDIVDYISNPNYKFLNWPDDYWPPRDKIATIEEWNTTVKDIRFLYGKSKSLIEGKKITDLVKKLPHVTSEHSLLREIIMIIDHNAYHIGQFVTMRMVINHVAKNKDSRI